MPENAVRDFCQISAAVCVKAVEMIFSSYVYFGLATESVLAIDESCLHGIKMFVAISLVCQCCNS